MARLRSMGEEGKGGFPPCNLLGGFVGQHPELPLLLSSSEQKKGNPGTVAYRQL